jgi:hypothetical protein
MVPPIHTIIRRLRCKHRRLDGGDEIPTIAICKDCERMGTLVAVSVPNNDTKIGEKTVFKATWRSLWQ